MTLSSYEVEMLKTGGNPRSPEWPRVRAEHLKENPVCVACGGTESPEVHHIQPFHEYPELELEPTNLVTLCEKDGHDCHFRFGHNLNWRNTNPNSVADAGKEKERLQSERVEQ